MLKGTIRRLITDRGFGFIRTGEEAVSSSLVGVAYGGVSSTKGYMDRDRRLFLSEV